MGSYREGILRGGSYFEATHHRTAQCKAAQNRLPRRLKATEDDLCPPIRTARTQRAAQGLIDHLIFEVNTDVLVLVDFRSAMPPAAHLSAPDAIARHPYIRMANIFITPEAGNRRLRVAPPADADFSGLAELTGNYRRTFTPAEVAGRVVEHRRVAYYGNVDVTDSVRTEVSLFLRPDDPKRVGIRYVIRRDEDGRLICLSEAIKTLGRAHAA